MNGAPLIVVLGPTGAGKSELALDLCEAFGGEIVNCDSVQLYRYMDIGTAKTPAAERRGIPHHLIDVLDPDEHFTAGDYARTATAVLQDIAARGKVPVVAGGTGFYLRALLYGLFQGPTRDERLRERLTRRSPASLHRLLRRFDPVAAQRIHPNDVQKLIRAVEVCLLARAPMTQLFRESATTPLSGFRIAKIGLNPPRDALAARIDERCAAMFAFGLIDEVRAILARGFPPAAKALLSIGYREAILHLQGQLSLQQALTHTQTATRRYAKRQRTWFCREPDVWWIPAFGSEKKVARDAMHHLQVDIRFI